MSGYIDARKAVGEYDFLTYSDWLIDGRCSWHGQYGNVKRKCSLKLSFFKFSQGIDNLEND